MKIYVASSVSNAKSVPFQNLIRWLDERGIEITFRWWEHEVDITDEWSMRRQAESELKAIRECDVYLMVLPGKMGAHVELGLALGMDKHVGIWRPCGYEHAGEYPCVFHYLPLVRRFDGSPVSDVRDWLRAWAFDRWCGLDDTPILIAEDYPCICGRPIDWSQITDDSIPNYTTCSCGAEYTDGPIADNGKATLHLDDAPMEELEAWWDANVWGDKCS